MSHSRFSATENGVCLADFNMSSSLALSPFKTSPRLPFPYVALCFLFDCNGTEPRGPGYTNATAGCDKPIYAYLGRIYDRDTPPAIPTGNCTYTYLPVLGAEAAAADYSQLLKAGFVLDWEGTGVGECPACIASGGQCRYNTSNAKFLCLCPAPMACCTGRHVPLWRPLSRPLERDAISAFIADLRSMAVRLSPPPPPPPPEPD